MSRKLRPKTSWRPLDVSNLKEPHRLARKEAAAIVATLQPKPSSWSKRDASRLIKTINEVIAIYRVYRENELERPDRRDVRFALTAVRDTARAFVKALQEIDIVTLRTLGREAGRHPHELNESPFNEAQLTDDDELRHIQRGDDDSPLINEEWLGGERLRFLKVATKHCLHWSEKILRRGLRNKSGPKVNDALNWMVEQLAHIHTSHTGVRFSRSRKRGSPRDFIETVLGIADPAAGPGQIEEAMKVAQRKIDARTNGGKIDRKRGSNSTTANG